MSRWFWAHFKNQDPHYSHTVIYSREQITFNCSYNTYLIPNPKPTMSDIVGKVKDFANKKLDQKAQPGNKVEGAADTDVNNSADISPSLPVPLSENTC